MRMKSDHLNHCNSWIADETWYPSKFDIVIGDTNSNNHTKYRNIHPKHHHDRSDIVSGHIVSGHSDDCCFNAFIDQS